MKWKMFSTQLDSQFGCAWICGQIVGWLDVLLYDGSCIENHNCLCAKYFLTAKDSLFMKLKPRRVLFVIRLYFQFHNSIPTSWFILFVFHHFRLKQHMYKIWNVPTFLMPLKCISFFIWRKQNALKAFDARKRDFFLKASKQTTEFSRHIKKLKVLQLS